MGYSRQATLAYMYNVSVLVCIRDCASMYAPGKVHAGAGVCTEGGGGAGVWP